jgi:hypothetical protein
VTVRVGDSERILNALGSWRSKDFKEVKCGLRTNWFRGGAFTGVPANFFWRQHPWIKFIAS